MPQAKTPPPWRRQFLRELAQCGSVALACERCGIDRTTAYPLRRSNPAFARSWDRALAKARERLRGAATDGTCGTAPERWRLRPRLDDDQVIRSSKTGKVCVARVGPGRWSARAEAIFLTELASSANIAAAARAAGVSTTAVYSRRRLWPEFARAWKLALEEGYDRLEAHLIHAATATLDPEPVGVPTAPVDVTFDQALNLLKLHRAGVRGGKAQRYDWRAQEPDIEEVRAEVIRRLAVMGRAQHSE